MPPLSTLKTGDCCFIIHIDAQQHLQESLLSAHISKGCRLSIISHLGSFVVKNGMKLFAIDHHLADHIHVIQIPSKTFNKDEEFIT